MSKHYIKASLAKEESLILLLKNDSQWAFNNIYQLYARRLFAFALEYCHQKETAEEIVEDTFIWVWNHRHDIRQEKTLSNLVFVKARHLLINAYRATYNSPKFEDYVDYTNSLHKEAQVSPMDYDEFLQVVRQSMERLPLTQRRVIELSRFESKSIKEISQLLNIKEQTVRNQLSLGLKQLMAFVRQSGYGVFSVLLWSVINP